MSSSGKEAVILAVISLLVIALIFSSYSKFEVFAKPRKTSYDCTQSEADKQGYYTKTCCWYEWDDDPQKFTGAEHMCQTCVENDIYLTVDCQPPQPGFRTAAPPVSSLPSSAGSAQPPSGNNTGGVSNGQTGLPSRLGNALPPSSLPPSNAVPPPPTLPSTTKQQTLTTICPNALPPDANGNCPTTSTNQQVAPSQSSGGSASNNSTPGHHHKGSNQQAQITGGETTVTKKHKGSKTDQGTTQSPS
jgi:hypothetical protein